MKILLEWEEQLEASHSVDESEWDAICVAQVQKVYTWLLEDCTEHDTPAYVMGKPHVRIDCPECLEALRTVGGE